MFDDQPTKPNQPEPPSNLPSEPVDMFAEVEKGSAAEPALSEQQPDALSAGLLKRKLPTVQVPPSVAAENQPVTAPAVYAMKEPVLGKVLLLIAVAGVVGGLGWGGWRLYQKYTGQLPLNNKEVAVPSVATTTQPPAVVKTEEPEQITDVGADVTAKMNNDEILFGEPIDSDKDGLDDTREQELGTDPNQADSDNDGLRDSDEVLIWKTNPLNPDSDGDSYVDGKEVKNGYNPLGAGKLFNVPAGVTTTSSTSSTS